MHMGQVNIPVKGVTRRQGLSEDIWFPEGKAEVETRQHHRRKPAARSLARTRTPKKGKKKGKGKREEKGKPSLARSPARPLAHRAASTREQRKCGHERRPDMASRAAAAPFIAASNVGNCLVSRPQVNSPGPLLGRVQTDIIISCMSISGVQLFPKLHCNANQSFLRIQILITKFRNHAQRKSNTHPQFV